MVTYQMNSFNAENLKRIYEAIDDHNARCPDPAVAVSMHPYSREKLGWDDIRGLPIWDDERLQPERFRIECPKTLPADDETEVTDAIGEEVSV